MKEVWGRGPGLHGTASRAAWVCALWSGVAARLIRERLAPNHPKGPLSLDSMAAILGAIDAASEGHDYLAERASEARALLGAHEGMA